MKRSALSLLELTIVMGLISLLLQLLLPAMTVVREAARVVQCGSHLKTIGVAANEHHEVHGRLPSGGWHFTWIGEPERGTGDNQPGGWAFNLLDYLAADETRTLGLLLDGDEREAALVQRCRTAIPVFHCPSRRSAMPYPQTWNTLPLQRDGRLKEPMEWTAKSDYAACVGDGADVEFPWRWGGPLTLEQGDDPSFAWPANSGFTGVIFGRSHVRHRQIRDGLSQTLLAGEKYVDADHYTTGEDFGDNESLYNGFNNDTCRSTLSPPRRDARGGDLRNAFGSAHASFWQGVMCDGSLRRLDYSMDAQLVQQLGNRNNAMGTPATQLTRKGTQYVHAR